VSEGREAGADSVEPDPEPIGLARDLAPRLDNLARLACAMLPAAACAIRWQVGADAGAICAGRPLERDLAARVAAALIATSGTGRNKTLSLGDAGPHCRLLDPAGIEALGAAGASRQANRMVGGVFAGSEAAVSVAVAPAPEAPESETNALLEIAGRAALSEAVALRLAASRNFWRFRASEALGRAARSGARDAAREHERAEVAGLISELSSLAEPQRFRAMGDRIAASVGCDRWLLATKRGETLQIEASAPALHSRRKGVCSSQFTSALRAGNTVVRKPGGDTAAGAPESEALGDAWIAIPMGRGAVALGGVFAPAVRSRAEAIAAAADPIIRAWIAERELAEHRALIQRMALRMYAAIDAERARISRPVQQLCFQVAREALSNAMRHSGASLIRISVERSDAAVRMIVADNGRGLPREGEARASMGLAGVAERLELMGGNLRVASGHSGTTLTAEIPEPP
jgi:hypothetical protein